jgi:hypothetical protein
LFGDGKGNFRETVFSTGVDFHEARVADLNGDRLPDILDKPYNWEAPRVDVWLQIPPGQKIPAAARPYSFNAWDQSYDQLFRLRNANDLRSDQVSAGRLVKHLDLIGLPLFFLAQFPGQNVGDARGHANGSLGVEK